TKMYSIKKRSKFLRLGIPGILFVAGCIFSLCPVGRKSWVIAQQKQEKPGQAEVPEAQRYVAPVEDKGKLTLVYQKDSRGDRVPDFSACGYMGGGVALPDAPVRVIVDAKESDNTARIQAAIDYVSQLPVDEHGVRGTVLLKKGRHLVAGTLQIQAG